MAPKVPLLEKMRSNPRDGWTIADVQRLCDEHGIDLMKPTRDSHYKAASPHLSAHQSIPYKRPIKPIYIRALVAMIDAHIECENKQKGAE